jgi:hypothetical protein
MATVFDYGIRDLEYLQGIKQADGVLFQIKMEKEDDFFPAFKKLLDDLMIRDGLVNVPFFKAKSVDERKAWIEAHSSSKKSYPTDPEWISKYQVRFLSLGGKKSDFLKVLNTDQQTQLGSGEWLSLEQVYRFFPVKNNKARRHTLIFRPEIWKVVPAPKQDLESCESYIYLATGKEISKEQSEGFRKCSIKLDCAKTICFCDDPVGPITYTTEHKFDSFFSPTYYKSLLQKCIRVRAEMVSIGKAKHPTEDILIYAFMKLFQHPGAFVPNIKRFVTGTESALKRLAVTLLEDAHCTKEAALALLGGALCARARWQFSPTYVEACKRWAAHGLDSSLYYVYNGKRSHIVPTTSHFNWRLSSECLKTLRSFDFDINLLSDIASCDGSRVETTTRARPLLMNIQHLLDQHCCTEIAHFFELEAGKSIKDIFDFIWTQGTSINGRKRAFQVHDKIQAAQKALWLALSSPKWMQRVVERKNTGNHIKVKSKIDDCWLAGLFSSHKHNVPRDIVEAGNEDADAPRKRKTIPIESFLHPENPFNIVSMREQARGVDEQLTPGIKRRAIEMTEAMLTDTGKKVANSFLGVSGTLKLKDGGYFINDQPWDVFKKQQTEFPIVQKNIAESFYDYLKFAFRSKSDALEEDALKRIKHKLKRLHPKVLKRLAMYLRPISSTIEMYKIAKKDGSGVYLSTDWTDCHVFQFLVKICVYMPGILRISSNFKFEIRHIGYWNMVRECIFDLLKSDGEAWSGVEFRDSRQLRPHQVEAVDEIMDRVNSNKRGILIWMDVGQGKTFIVSTVLGNLLKNNELPKYCVYTLPPSALESVQKEFQMGHLPYVHCNPNAGKCKGIQPHVVNFIFHDHLRVLKDNLIAHASDTLFIIDEFHLLMNDTQRTSIGLELAKLSHNFIGMSGTIIMDKDESKVIQWVEQVVNFEVTLNNYKAGVAALVSRKMELGIQENRQMIDIPMSNVAYRFLVEPRFGGVASNTQFHEAVAVCYDEIYSAIMKRILHHAKTRFPIFVVVKDVKTQENMERDLLQYQLNAFCIGKGKSIVLTPGMPCPYHVIITTPRHSTGYTLTACDLMITSIYFTNQATREQLEGRVLRMGQKSPIVDIEILHTGILSYTLKHYEDARSIAKALSDIQKS